MQPSRAAGCIGYGDWGLCFASDGSKEIRALEECSPVMASISTNFWNAGPKSVPISRSHLYHSLGACGDFSGSASSPVAGSSMGSWMRAEPEQ